MEKPSRGNLFDDDESDGDEKPKPVEEVKKEEPLKEMGGSDEDEEYKPTVAETPEPTPEVTTPAAVETPQTDAPKEDDEDEYIPQVEPPSA